MRPRRPRQMPVPYPSPWPTAPSPWAGSLPPSSPAPPASPVEPADATWPPGLPAPGWLDPAWTTLVEPPSDFPAELLTEWDVTVSTEDGWLLCEAAMPGVKPENIRVTLFRDGLLISAQHQEETEIRGEGTYEATARVSAITRMVPFPSPVSPQDAETEFQDGVLRVRLRLT